MASYDDKAIKGAQLQRLTEKEIYDRLKGSVPEAIAEFLCSQAARINALESALAERNLGDVVADSLDAQTLKAGGVDVKTRQSAKTNPTASGSAISFVDSATQDENGEMTVTRKSVRTATTSQTGVVQLTDSHTSTSTTTAATPKNVKEAYDLASGKSSTSHTHSVSINGNTKTIAASDGTAVDLGTYKVFNYSKMYVNQAYNANTKRYIQLAFKLATYTSNWEESSMFKLVVHDGQFPKELVFRLWLKGNVNTDVVPADPSNPKLYRVYSENFSESELDILDVRLFVVEKSVGSIRFTIGIFIDRNYLQAQYVSYQLYPLSYATGNRSNTIDNGLSSWTYTVEQNNYSENIVHDNVFTTLFEVNDLTVGMNINGNAATATTANTAKAYDTSFSGTNSINTALTTHAHGLQHHDFTRTVPAYDASNPDKDTWLTNIGNSNTSFWLKSLRTSASAPPWLAANFGAGIAFGGADTKGTISVKYDTPFIVFAGGNSTSPKWWINVSGTSGNTYILPPMGTGANADKYAINISGTAAAADTAAEAGYATALKVTSAIGSSIKPVYIGANGIPQVIPNDSTYSDYLTLNVINARTASEASTANKWKTGRSFTIKDDSRVHAGTSTTGVDGSGNVELLLPTEITLTKVNATTFNGTATTATKLQSTNVGSSTKPVFFNANGVPEAVGTVPHGSMTYLNLNVDNAYSADAVGGVRLVIGEFGGDANTIYLD